MVKLAREQQLAVIPVPGSCALIAALSAAGVPCDSFLFTGFLPAKKAARLANYSRRSNRQALLFFMSQLIGILDCIDDIGEVYGADFDFVVAKELTKTFERFITGSASEIKQWLEGEKGRTNGEFVVIIPPIKQDSDEAAQNLSP